MKKLVLIGLMLQSLISFGQEQDYSIINFIPSKVQKQITEIWLNGDNKIGSALHTEYLQYKVYSEGRITVSYHALGYNVALIEIKKGNTYYFEINQWDGKHRLVDEEKGKKLLEDKSKIYVEEDKNNPIIEMTKEAISKTPKSGSGFLLSESGLVITNHHVIENGNKIMIKGINGDYTTSYSAKVIADDKNNDLSILQLENKTIKFEPIPYTIRTRSADTGEDIYVLGYPMISAMGEEVKLTTGVISAKTGYNGDITSYQVSAPVQGGNSGGPLFDKQGNLTGIINAKIMAAEGVTYAIKTNYINALIDLLPTAPVLNETSKLTGLSLQEQVKKISPFVYIIEVNN